MAASNRANTIDYLRKLQEQRKLLLLALKLDWFLNGSKWKSMMESSSFTDYMGSGKRYRNTSKKKGNICKCVKCQQNVKKCTTVVKRDSSKCKTFQRCRKGHNNSAALRNHEKHFNNDNESKNEIDKTGDDVVNDERKEQNFYEDLNNDNQNTTCQSEHQRDVDEESSCVLKSGIRGTKEHKRQMNGTRQRISKAKQHKKKLNSVKKKTKVTKVVKRQQNPVKKCAHKCKKGRKKTGLKQLVNYKITPKANKHLQQNNAEHVRTGGNDVTTDKIPPTTPGIFSKKGIRVKQQERFDKKKAFKHVNRRRVYRPSRPTAIRQKSEGVSNRNIEPRPKKRIRKFLNKSVEGIFKESKKK